MADPKTADPKTVLEFVKKNGVKLLDLRFTDLPGLWHHVSYPIDQLSESSFEEGFGMDGSSIRGWAAIHESDMLLMPDPNSYMLDPFTEVAGHQAALRSRPALHCPQSRNVPELDRHRGHRLFRRRS